MEKKNKLLRALSLISILLGYISIASFAFYGYRLLQNGNTTFGWITIICSIVFFVIQTAILFMDKDDKKEKKRKKKAYKKVFKYVKTGIKIAILVITILAASKVGAVELSDKLLLVWLVFTIVVDIVISINLYILKKSMGAIKNKFKKNKEE